MFLTLKNVLQKLYNQPNTYYIFNHVDLLISYHSGEGEEWGSSFRSNGGRIVCKYLLKISKIVLVFCHKDIAKTNSTDSLKQYSKILYIMDHRDGWSWDNLSSIVVLNVVGVFHIHIPCLVKLHILVFHLLIYTMRSKSMVVIVQQIDFEFLVGISILGSPELKKVV